MNRLLITVLCLLTLAGCGNRPFPPLSGDARNRVQQQLDRCLVQVNQKSFSLRDGWPETRTLDGTALIIAADGTAIVDGTWGSPLFVGEDERGKKFRGIWKSLKLRTADGHWVPYQQVALRLEPPISIIAPVKPLKNQPYLDITKITDVPMGLSVYVRHKDYDGKKVRLIKAVVTSDPAVHISNDSFKPANLVFSTKTGQHLGWGSVWPETYATVHHIPASMSNLIEKHTDIRFTQTGKVQEPVDQSYSLAYNPNRNSMGKISFDGRPSHDNYYVLTPDGTILTQIPLGMPSVRYKAEAVLSDGQKIKMRWVTVDKAQQLGILRPVKPLKHPLTPVVWALGSQPQFGQRYYSFSGGKVGTDYIIGHDPVFPNRYVMSFYPPFMLFNNQGRAVALTRSPATLLRFCWEMSSAEEAVQYICKLNPELTMKTEKTMQPASAGRVIASLGINPQQWAFVHSRPFEEGHIDPDNSAICIDASGYFIMPTKYRAPAWVKDHQIRAAYDKKKDVDYIRDAQGPIGKIAIIYNNPSLGISIGKALSKPIRAMRALNLNTTPPAQHSDKLYGINVGVFDGRLVPFQFPLAANNLRAPKSVKDAEYGCLCVNSDGRIIGYVTESTNRIGYDKMRIVDLAEIAKKLAYVKKALGDK